MPPTPTASGWAASVAFCLHVGLTRDQPHHAEKGAVALCNQLEIAAGQTNRRALGFPRVAKQLAFQPIEPVGGGEEAIASGIPHDDSRRLRRDFDDVGIRHFFPASLFLSPRRQRRGEGKVPRGCRAAGPETCPLEMIGNNLTPGFKIFRKSKT